MVAMVLESFLDLFRIIRNFARVRNVELFETCGVEIWLLFKPKTFPSRREHLVKNDEKCGSAILLLESDVNMLKLLRKCFL